MAKVLYLEPYNDPELDFISYIRVNYLKSEGPIWRQQVRFYEAYWAPIMAGGSTTWGVIKWLISRTLTPLWSLLTPWRLRARLRRATLHAFWSRLTEAEKAVQGYQNKDLSNILKSYDDFEGPSARRDFKKGSFSEFVHFLEKTKPDQATRNRLIKLAKQWHRNYIVQELSNAVVLVTLAVSLALGFGALVWLAFLILEGLQLGGISSWLTHFFSIEVDMFSPNWGNILVIVTLLAGLFRITLFLKDYLGDVQMWATYTETDEKFTRRRKVLKTVTGLLCHVLKQDECKRVVVVAHSLGTTVAYDALLTISRYNRASNKDRVPMDSPLPLKKIEHFITLATPIDKIYYFFESYRSKVHRYNRIIEQVRGDIGEVPFSKNQKPHIHWINFWDRADIISGSVETPAHARSGAYFVDNCEVYNRWFPDAYTSHFAYFDHSQVMQVISDVIFNSKYSFVDAPRDLQGIPDYKAQLVAISESLWINRVFQILMLVLPWLILIGLGMHIFGANTQLTHIMTYLSVGVILILAVGWLVSWLHGHLESY